ncbi:cytochrome c biogenesis protein [Candidatus Woesearchaeota archaeon]|jgi:cytochrome c biogenesis protein CcdA|nr:cytochrome c biogenesis protein [Candidatus Woesearchaeota archaeon]MBT4368128.1 cytochrome c biogenesis protein [Candidatus Woesearchaeota archaeon]MBT4712616.1 cytochrome c biogenesis protein [Candidatus Woesearchaeota archaeon]MBT6639529.1 cytochrome c biogenesis protein [Candidatus Woesearchaeota archaeon]MBT7133701.1 cytochrome c biogenesis protein [Candidatus Woesearchaeota archaeon]
MKLKIIIPLIFIIIFSGIALADTCVYFFHGDGCQHCAKAYPLMDELKANSSVEVHVFEIYNNRSNIGLLQNFFNQFDVDKDLRGVPTVIVGDEILIGDSMINSKLKPVIKNNPGISCPLLNQTEKQEISSLSLLTVIGAALVDSINPCAIAVLLILLSALLAAGNKKRAIKAGFAFTIAIYVIYFLFGLGLFSAIQVSGLSLWFYKIVGVLAILIGLANLKDYFWYAKLGFVMEIPRKWRPTLKKLLRKVTTPWGAFLIGFVVCLFELPCTGGPYLFILGLLAEKTTRMSAIPILLIYNLFFVIPLIVITVLISIGKTDVKKANAWKDKNLRMLHLIAGIVMLLLGIIVVLGIL